MENNLEELKPLGHDNDKGIITKAPTCTEEGIKTFTCKRCDHKTTEVVNALGHDLHEEIVKDATCGTDGIKAVTCNRCDYKENITIPATGQHTYGDWTTVTEPTCCKEGVKKHTCTVCQKEETASIPATNNHIYGEWIIDTPATCGTPGSKHKACINEGCTDIVTEVIPATGNHSYGDWTPVTPPTCTTAGSKSRTCSVCGNVEIREVDPLGHDLSDWKTVTAPTCKEGTEERHCERPGCQFSDIRTIPATGAHTYGDWVTDSDPTCTEGTHKHHVCNICGHKESITDSNALGHNMVEDWGKKWVAYWTCNGCHQRFESDQAVGEHVLVECGTGYTSTCSPTAWSLSNL